MPSAQMVFDVIARDGASGSFRAMSREANGAAASFDKVGKAAAGITVLFAAFAVNAAVKFESAMTRISTQAGVPIGQIKALSNAILGLSPKVGFNPDELATSLYHVESAFRTTGITAGKAIGIVENASKLAKIGNADLETTTQAIIGVLASNIKGVSNAQDAAAQLNQLVGTGDTNLQTVAKSIATGILPTAATLGLSFKDVAAGLATLTDNVTPADQAARLLKTSLLTLIKPSAQQAAAFEQLGLSTLQIGDDFHKPNGLLTGVEDLKTHLDAVFPATQKTALTTGQLDKAQQAYYQTLVAGGTNAKDATKLSEKYRTSIEGVSVATLRANTVARALGGSKTAGTFLTLIQEIDRLKSKYTDFGTAAQAANKFQEAWANQQKTAKQKLDELKASWDVFLVQAGNEILPTLKKIVDALAKHPGIIKGVAAAVGLLAAAWTISKFASAFTILSRLTAAILGVGTASATAASEVAAANLTGAGSGAATGAFAAGGAARAGSSARFAGLAGSALTKIAIPVAITLVTINAAKALQGLVADFKKGHYADGISKELSSQLAVGLTFGLSKGIADAVKSHDPLKFITGNPGFKLAQKGLGALGIGPKPLTAEFIPKNFSGVKDDLVFVRGSVDEAATAFRKAGNSAESWWKTVDDRGRIAEFQDSLKHSSTLLDSNTNSLVGNSDGAKSNRAGIVALVDEAKLAAAAYARTTGNQDDYTKSLQLAIPQIEAAATATGLNKQQVDALVNSISGIPPQKTTNVTVSGYLDALNNVNTFLASLAQIPSVIRVPIETFIASPTPANQLAGSAFGVDTVGRHAAGGIAKGWSWVGEKGPELVNFGSPSRVLNHQDSLAAASGNSGPLVSIGEFHAHDEVDVAGVAQQIAFRTRAVMTSRRL